MRTKSKTYSEVTIESVAHPDPGAFKIGPFGSSLKKDELVSEGIPVVGIENVLSNKFIPTARKFITEEKFSQLSQYLIKPGDILVTTMGTIGRAAVVPRDIGKVIIDSHLFRMRIDQSKADPIYVCYALNGYIGIQQDLERRASGAIMAGLNTQILKTCCLPLPPLSEQKYIAAILNKQMAAVDQARAAAKAQLEAAKALPAAYFRQAFCNITPLAVGLGRDIAPRGWKWQQLTSLARLESGHTPSRYYPEWWGGNVPWISLADIRDLDGKVALETRECTNEAGIANSSARILPAGTVILSRTASVGFVAIMGREMATSQDFVNWICGPELDPYFLMFLLLASRDYIRSLSSGAIHQTVYVPTVKAFEVCIPSLSEQRRIATFLKEHLAKADRLHQGLEERLDIIDKLPFALLRQAFSGKL